MNLIKIITLVILFIASLILLVWIYRPGSSENYQKASEIPLNDDVPLNNLKDETKE